MPAAISDYIQRPSAGTVTVIVGTWVQLVNNATSTAYVSTAVTDANGKFTVLNVPAGTYTVNTGPTNTGPWTSTGDTSYIVADQSGIVNAKDFGAKGDGSTDDTSALNTAIAAAVAAKAQLSLPPGNYIITGALSCGSTTGLIIQGHGGRSAGAATPTLITYTPSTGARVIDARSSVGFAL